jgi:phospholipid/cholesterol/gamma-HCH transport system permease protein
MILIINAFKNILFILQEYTLMTLDIIRGLPSSWKYRRDLLHEMYLIGAQSFPIIFLGGLFVGVILAVETGNKFDDFGAKALVGRTVVLGMVRELGPLITGLLLAARTGAKNASELGSMKISEQIEALRAYGTNPVYRLVIPRTVASVTMFFPLSLLATFCGVLGGFLASTLWLSVDFSFVWNSGMNGLMMKDLFVGFTKPFIFGYFIATISSFYGLQAGGGTSGVGQATIKAVVGSSFAVLFADFVITKIVWEVL